MIIDGEKLAKEIRDGLRTEVLELKKKNIIPRLAVILANNDPASAIYVANKEKVCHNLGIYSEIHRLGKESTEQEILELIGKLNSNKEIHGVLVQLPLPPQIDAKKIIISIDPKKDVDCFHPENLGKLILDRPLFLPCTPSGIIEILQKHKIEIEGNDCVIVGRSNIVGKPLAIMLANAGATVTLCHSKTKKLKEKTLLADIIFMAVGKAGLLTADMVKQETVVVDVGINRNNNGKLVGDVDFENVSKIASAITPVPGGVGPMTIAMLMKNTIKSAKNNATGN